MTNNTATSDFLAACRSEPHDRVPVWFMRQAGRSLPEYLAIRGEGTILDAIAKPDLATEITLQPIKRYGVDAAILYSDIVVPIAAIGFGVDIAPGVGPVTEQPFVARADLDRIRPLEPTEDTPYVLETVRNLVAELPVPLIGFAGAPFTVASYLIEGGPSRTYGKTKAMMHGDPVLFGDLLDRLADLAIASVSSQLDQGAQAFQIFDSWAGALSPNDYITHVLPHTRRVFDQLANHNVPGIHFGVNTGELLATMSGFDGSGDGLGVGASVIGVDWRVPLDAARARVRPDQALQGNLDPAVCLAPIEAVKDETRRVLDANDGHPGHVFNLGHGVTPDLDPGVLAEVVDLVHAEGRVTAAP